MPTSEFEKKIHRWVSLICCFGEQQMPGRGWKHLQFAGIGLVDAYHQVDIKNPTTIAEGLFFMSKKSKMFL